MSRILLLVAVASCGRISFDPASRADDARSPDAPAAVTCAPEGHDEDADGFEDGCDVCPHISDAAQADGDGDRVGDACDPAPTTAGERIVFFDSFVGPNPAWEIIGPVTYMGDQLVTSRMDLVVLRLPGTFSDDTVTIGGHIAGGPARPRQLTVNANTENATYYCELYDDGAPKFGLTYTYDVMLYVSVADQPLPAAIGEDDVVLTLSTARPTAGCSTQWDLPRQLTGDVPADLGAAVSVSVLSLNLDGQFDYFIQIRSE